MQQHNAARKGRAAEYLAAAWLLRNHRVWVSVMPDAASTDLMVQLQDDPAKKYSVQVKEVYPKLTSGRYFRTVNTSRSDGRRYVRPDVDFILAVDSDSCTFWLFPTPVNASRLRLTKRYSGYAYGWNEAAPKFGGWA